jgi:hypothetical protein
MLQEDSVPKDLLLSGMAIRFNLIDHPERLAAFMPHAQGVCHLTGIINM